ncbi:hypothetical protein [Hymenobacter sp. UYP22]|uniref:hypothetical protein n=1 Tax=Hymenobacter sp. UYP22 TaxID=3156348 RepID=UPI00339849F1
MPQTAPFSLLYVLAADDQLMFELKRLDVESDEPAKKYFWFHFNYHNNQLTPLTFSSMEEGETQRRAFAEGLLEFDTAQGTYTPPAPAEPVKLSVPPEPQLPLRAEAAVRDYFGWQ